MKCIIVSNGSIHDYERMKKWIDHRDFIIGVDGGSRHLFEMDILPHIIVGDLDSIDEKIKRYFEEKNVVFHKFPKKKDFTDTELAIEYALEKGASEIVFLGAIGSRMDHTIANITLLLPLIEKGICAKVVDERNEVMIIDKKVKIEGEIGEIVSIIPITEKVEGITFTGLLYPLCDATMKMGVARGISNQLIDKKATINIKSGKLLVIKARD